MERVFPCRRNYKKTEWRKIQTSARKTNDRRVLREEKLCEKAFEVQKKDHRDVREEAKFGHFFAELKAVKKSALNAKAKEGTHQRVELEKPHGGAAIVAFHSARTNFSEKNIIYNINII